MMLRGRLAVLALVAAVGAAGCTEARPAASVPPAAAVPRVLLETAGLRLPLDAYQLSLADTGRVARAGRVLVRECLRRLGFAPAAQEVAPAGPRTWNERRYGLVDPVQAGRGYWPESRSAPRRPARPAAGPAEGDALTGRGAATVHGRPVPAGGCSGEAQRRLRAADPAGADRYLAQRLSTDSFFGSQRDPRVVAVFRAWSGCMAASGHRYAGPLDPPQDPRFRTGPSTVEVEVARADVACKRRTNLVGIWVTVEVERQRASIAANRGGLELARAAFAAELSVATAAGA
jgi:hypothetical protein